MVVTVLVGGGILRSPGWAFPAVVVVVAAAAGCGGVLRDPGEGSLLWCLWLLLPPTVVAAAAGCGCGGGGGPKMPWRGFSAIMTILLLLRRLYQLCY